MSARFAGEPLPEEAGPRDPLPIVFLHGFLGQPSMWAEVAARLPPRGPRVLAALPGHGPQPWVASGEDFTAVVDRIAGSLPFAGAALLVGYSMGARIALALMLRHPERARAAVLVGVDPGLRDPAARAQRRAWDRQQASDAESLGIPAFAERWAALPLFATQRTLAPAVVAAQREARQRHEPGAIGWAMRTLGLGAMPPCWQALAQSPAPVTFITGEADTKFTAIAREASALCRAGQHLIAPGAGHNVAIEAPALVARAIEEMAARCAREPAGLTAARSEEPGA